jgi:hypothetical protein
MAFTNSPLVKYTKLSPNHSGQRNHEIDTITIHCVVGQCSVETLGEIFAPVSRQASCNYGIGSDGRIGLYCEEKNRSWCSSSASNDHRAITIEVASDTTHPYAVNDKAFAALLNLVTDICKRNGIKQLLWNGDKSLIGQVDKQNMTVHRWFANKSCPGDYLYNRHSEIATEVNKRLNAGSAPSTGVLYRVQTGAFSNKANADALLAKVKAAGFETYMVQSKGLYKVQVGAYGVKSNADAMAAKLKAKGFDVFITTEGGTPAQAEAPKAATITEGSKVKVKQGAKSYTGGGIASFIYGKVYTVDELKGDRAVLDKNGICTPFKISDLILQ